MDGDQHRDRLAKAIKAYEDAGWKFYSDPKYSLNSSVTSPRGLVYNSRMLALNICTICADEEEAEIYGCNGVHSEKDLAEEEEARRFSRLLSEMRRLELAEMAFGETDE